MKSEDKETKNRKSLTLLQAIEKIAELAENSQLSPSFMRKVAHEADYLAQQYGITPIQAILFCVCVARGRYITFENLARYLSISNIKILGYGEDFDVLIRKSLLTIKRDEYEINQLALRALKYNQAYQKPQYVDLDCFSLFSILGELFDNLRSDSLMISIVREEIKEIMEGNQQIDFVKRMKKLCLRDEDFLLLLFFCHLKVNEDDDYVDFHQIDVLFDSTHFYGRRKSELRRGEHLLMNRNLLEHCCDDGVVDTLHFKLTSYAINTLLHEMDIKPKEEEISELLKSEKLVFKEMFYGEKVSKQVSELNKFIEPACFKQIQERMKEKGFRNGFACLFYGAPGTGKTETVYQLSRRTGRDIMLVDVPQIKSKWVGDSEKNVKALFERYKELVNRSEIAPILLFNEADAIIGTRKNGAESAVDKMENAIQNIILQEMENLNGIMIATTNLERNLDPAFERRFLYKIKFEKPDASVQCKIWKEMIPELREEDAIKLSNQYDLSGGQIENIARKHAIQMILYGNDKDNMYAALCNYCDVEKLKGNNERKKIGF